MVLGGPLVCPVRRREEGGGRGDRTCAQRPHLMEIVERELSAVRIKGWFGVVLLLLEMEMLAGGGGGGAPPRLQGIETWSAHAGRR